MAYIIDMKKESFDDAPKARFHMINLVTVQGYQGVYQKIKERLICDAKVGLKFDTGGFFIGITSSFAKRRISFLTFLCCLLPIVQSLSCDQQERSVRSSFVAVITEDEEIDIHTFCGGIELFVPTHVNVLVKSRSFIGGVGNSAIHNTDPKTPCLHIVASNFIGGVDIKN